MTLVSLPSSPDLENAILEVLTRNVGELTNEQITQKVIAFLNISKEAQQVMHTPTRTELDYRLAWARTRASKKNLIERTAPKTWKVKS